MQLSCDGDFIVSGYEAALTSAVENVLRNAIRHSPTGGVVSVDVSTDDGKVIVSVADQGAGVPEASLDKLFDPFYRSETDAQAGTGGTGLGLAIAKRAIQKNAGRIAAHNLDAGGLCVTIILPRPV